MKITASILSIYGLLILIGGLIGHWKASSTASLVSGLFCGSILLVLSYAIARGKLQAQYMALAFTFALDAFFTHRFAKSLHFFPSGMMSLISLIVLIVVALKIRKTVKAR
ncbi:MAG: TMEM14 family protein [Candidatus Rhabdochlamydia sp.]